MTDEMIQYFKHKKAKVLDYDKYTRFAIFVPLIEKDGELHIIFQIRSRHVRQPGEICFPGGKVEKSDPSFEFAAIRELSEELGVSSEEVELLGELDYMVTPFRFMLFPFIGTLPKNTNFQLNHGEVEDIFFAPLSKLVKMTPKEHQVYLEMEPEKNFPYHLIPNGEDYHWRTGLVNEQFYEYNGYVIWGLTARILTHVLDEIQSVSPLSSTKDSN
ncbi:coenzyme A pyrophosphatase [Salipaludibacillus keqinensis]|uniref:Coenzyme A pyrophosphatase n=2 Tax=Salipaludibacillus keqinensis TaxID=2045207 RepID=A0A323TKZ9_9BACI|nr:coenzyme A pyrophosphatase [Salipaludibacillus keqinensis]